MNGGGGWWRMAIVAAGVALMVVAAGPAGAQAPLTAAPSRNMSEIPPEAVRIINEVMSPFCPGLILTNCPSLQADSLRKAIRERVAAGATHDQIIAELYATYGEVIRAAPQRRGIGLLAWVTPAAAVLVAALFIVAWLRRSRGARSARDASAPATLGAPAGGAAPDDDRALLARLDDEVRRG